MASQTATRQGSATRVSKDAVAKKFVDMYYGILNNSHELMYRFYRAGSTVTVSEAMENGTTVMETADTEETVRELVKSIFADVTIKVDTTVPQFSLEGSVLILVSGTIHKTEDEIRRMFSQAFLLAPQENGYYVLTDSMQILGHSSSPILKAAGKPDEQVASGDNHGTHDSQQMVPRTPRSQLGPGMVPPPLASQSHDFIDKFPDRPEHHHVSSMDLQSNTPPVHETQMELPDRSPPMSQVKADRQSYARALTQGPGTEPHVPGQLHSQEMMGAANLMAGPGNLGRVSLNDVPHRSFSGVSNTFSQGGSVPHRHRRSNTSDGRLLHPVGGHGVFIARLPFGTEASDVVEVMGQFGTVVGGVDGVQVRDGRNGCYAFVSFDTLEAAEAAIRGPVKFGGKQVFIERKYSTGDGQQIPGSVGLPHVGRGGGRGRPGPGSRRTGSIG